MILALYKKKDSYDTMVTASDINSSTREGTGGQTMLACYTGAHTKNVINTISFRVKSNCSTSDNDNENQNSMHKTILFNKLYIDPIAQYKRNWGISTICRLLGGGKTTLASGNGTASSSWGNPGTTPVSAPVPRTGTKPVPASVFGTSNWNTSLLIGGQFSPYAVSNNSWQQSPQSSSTSSNNTSQTSNISNKGQSSNPGLSSRISTIYLSTSTSQTISQQNTTSRAQSTGKNLPVFSVPQVTGNLSSLATTGRTGFGAVSNFQSINSPPTNGENKAVNSSTKQINTMQAALYAQDGWGSQYINKDSQWDVPHSPEHNTKVEPLTGITGSSGPSNINNGTDLWEATLRNSEKPPIQIPIQNANKTSWGHTPASNIGGTWVEDGDVSSVKGRKANTGNWSIKQATTMSNHRGQGQPPPQGLFGPPKKDIRSKRQSWNSSNTVFNDLNRPPRFVGQDPRCRDNGIVDHREIGSDARDGISDCLNDTISSSGAVTEPMWSEPRPHHVQHHVKSPLVGPPPSVISSLGVRHGQGPRPGLLSTQHNISKHCGKADMTAAAGWNNNGSGNMGDQCPIRVNPSRVSMPQPSKMVDQQQLWHRNRRNGAWGDVSGRSQNDLNVVSPWAHYKIKLRKNAGGLWPNSDWKPDPKSKNVLGDCSNNDVDQSSWRQKNINQNKDYTSQSKPYRILAENEVKKEDVEAVECSYNITVEEPLELMSSRGLGGGDLDSSNSHTSCGLHPDDQNSFDQSNTNQQRLNSQQLPFAVPSVGNNSNQQQVMIQKMLAQQQPNAQQNTVQQQYSQGGGSRQMQFQPTAQQLVIAQQIKTAVQDGYLNNQTLNQPLEPQTLFLISRLLQQIQILQQNVQAVATNPKSCPATMTASIAINKARQEIISLQNQIACNQTMHMNAQDHQNQSDFSSLSTPSALTDEQVGDFFKNDPLTLLQYGFSDLVMNKDSQISRQGFATIEQSRLNQWKLPGLDQDDLGMPNGFSRALGATFNSPTFNSLLNQGDGTCSNVGARSDTGWPDNVENNKEIWPNNSSNTQSDPMSSKFAIDQVPEFEPGKPWKGYQMKNIDDDHTITPGSVVCSPLSLAVTMKDSNNSDLLNISGKTSTTYSESIVDMPYTPLFFSSPIWRYNPPPSSAQFNSQLGKVNEPKNNCSDGNLRNNLWGGFLGSSDKSCSPPTYLTGGSDKKTENATNNGWPRWPSNNTSLWQLSSNNVDSTWLLLRNLTQQIDGSTLKTLCVQHGPLLNFYMYLNHNLALIKYSTREVAIKAQKALNNCVFRNTIIFAELPTIAEVQLLLTFLSGGGNDTSGINSAQQQ